MQTLEMHKWVTMSRELRCGSGRNPQISARLCPVLQKTSFGLGWSGCWKGKQKIGSPRLTTPVTRPLAKSSRERRRLARRRIPRTRTAGTPARRAGSEATPIATSPGIPRSSSCSDGWPGASPRAVHPPRPWCLPDPRIPRFLRTPLTIFGGIQRLDHTLMGSQRSRLLLSQSVLRRVSWFKRNGVQRVGRSFRFFFSNHRAQPFLNISCETQ